MEIISLKKIHYSILPAIVWLIISTVLLILPGSAFPKENWLSRIWFDKWVHIALFGILVLAWCYGIPRSTIVTTRKKIFLLITVLAICYGIIMELVQHYLVANRGFELGDIIADALGSFAGFAFSSYRYIKK